MKSKTQGMINNAITGLKQIQSICIGVFINSLNGDTELVLEDNGTSLVTVSVGKLWGIATDHNIPKNRGMYVPFPDGKTLSQMMEHPSDFHIWYSNNITK